MADTRLHQALPRYVDGHMSNERQQLSRFVLLDMRGTCQVVSFVTNPASGRTET